MKKAFTVLLAFVLCFSLFSCDKKTSPVEDFEYELENGEVVITGYKGADRKIYIPKKIKNRPVSVIGFEAFKGYDLTHIVMPDTIKEIQKNAFYGCECLVSVKFSNNLEEIGQYAFWNCDLLTDLDFPKSLKRINACAFLKCSALKNVNLPKNLEFLACDSFASCESLKSLRIPDDTEMDMLLYEQMLGYDIGYMKEFKSPVGGSCIYYYTNKYSNAQNPGTFDELPTVLIVSDGSAAYEQVKKYEKYGIQYEVK